MIAGGPTCGGCNNAKKANAHAKPYSLTSQLEEELNKDEVIVFFVDDELLAHFSYNDPIIVNL